MGNNHLEALSALTRLKAAGDAGPASGLPPDDDDRDGDDVRDGDDEGVEDVIGSP